MIAVILGLVAQGMVLGPAECVIMTVLPGHLDDTFRTSVVEFQSAS
jgi:hypothetical protein